MVLTQRMSALIPPRKHSVVRRVFIQQLSEFRVGGVLIVDFADFRDHFASRFVPFSMTSFFVQLLNDPLPGGPILQRKLGNDATQFVGLGQLDFVQRNADPQTKLVKPIHYAPMNFTEDYDTFSAVG